MFWSLDQRMKNPRY